MVAKSKSFFQFAKAIVLALPIVTIQLYPVVVFGSDLLDGKGVLCSCDENKKKAQGEHYCKKRFAFYFTQNKVNHLQFYEHKDAIRKKQTVLDYNTTSSQISIDILQDGSFYYKLDRQSLTLSYGQYAGYKCKLAATTLSFEKMIETEKRRLTESMHLIIYLLSANN
jgi:hypothetical protein